MLILNLSPALCKNSPESRIYDLALKWDRRAWKLGREPGGRLAQCPGLGRAGTQRSLLVTLSFNKLSWTWLMNERVSSRASLSVSPCLLSPDSAVSRGVQQCARGLRPCRKLVRKSSVLKIK